MSELFFKELPVAITVTDIEGKIVYMNDRSASVFEKYGGKELINKNIFDYHNERSSSMISNMMQEKSTNAYTIEKKGIKKMIYQSPWLENGVVRGMVEFSFEIPLQMSHFNRD